MLRLQIQRYMYNWETMEFWDRVCFALNRKSIRLNDTLLRSFFSSFFHIHSINISITTTPTIFQWMSTSGLWACETNIIRQRICPLLHRRVAVPSILDRDLNRRKSAFLGDLDVVKRALISPWSLRYGWIYATFVKHEWRCQRTRYSAWNSIQHHWTWSGWFRRSV